MSRKGNIGKGKKQKIQGGKQQKRAKLEKLVGWGEGEEEVLNVRGWLVDKDEMVVPGEELGSTDGMRITVSIPTKKTEKAKQKPRARRRKKEERVKEKSAGGSGCMKSWLGAGISPTSTPTTWCTEYWMDDPDLPWMEAALEVEAMEEARRMQDELESGKEENVMEDKSSECAMRVEPHTHESESAITMESLNMPGMKTALEVETVEGTESILDELEGMKEEEVMEDKRSGCAMKVESHTHKSESEITVEGRQVIDDNLGGMRAMQANLEGMGDNQGGVQDGQEGGGTDIFFCSW